MRRSPPPPALSLVVALLAACASTPTPAPPAVAPVPATSAPAPAPERQPPPTTAQLAAESLCARMDPAAPELVRVHIEDVILQCPEGHLESCQGETHFTVANCSDEPVELRSLSFVDAAPSKGAMIIEPGDRTIAPGSSWSYHSKFFRETSLLLRVDVVDAHEVPITVPARPMRVSNPARVAAMAACVACDGEWGIPGLQYRDACNCKTRDAYKECRDGGDCESACMFASWEVSRPAAPARCTGKGKARVCSARAPAIGRPVGRCAARVAIRSCHKFLQDDIAAEPDQPLPWGVSQRCID